MNSISWLIYFGSIGDNSAGFGILGVLIFFIAAVATVTWWVANGPGTKDDADAKYAGAIARRVRLIAWPLCIALWATALLIPDKRTVYAIAASEVGAQVAKSEVANDAMVALHAWIKKQIEPGQK